MATQPSATLATNPQLKYLVVMRRRSRWAAANCVAYVDDLPAFRERGEPRQSSSLSGWYAAAGDASPRIVASFRNAVLPTPRPATTLLVRVKVDLRNFPLINLLCKIFCLFVARKSPCEASLRRCAFVTRVSHDLSQRVSASASGSIAGCRRLR